MQGDINENVRDSIVCNVHYKENGYLNCVNESLSIKWTITQQGKGNY